jgi:ATP adenylyltransferase
VRFTVRVLAGLRRKAEAREEQDAAERSGKAANPFLPPEKDLVVADVTDTHLALLNKFNVVDHHLLIITRQFEDQETLLTLADFEALWTCMAEYEALGFYNGGADAGASQRHKHLQVVPLPIGSNGHAVPMAPLFAGASTDRDGFGAVPAFPFRHAFCRLPPDLWKSPPAVARATFEMYGTMLTRVGMTPPAASGAIRQSMPYCFLATREWMLLVPRSKEHLLDISFNSLAYAGSLFVYNEELLARLRAYGPMNALRDVALPK